MNIFCPLCNSNSILFKYFRNRIFLRCQFCNSLFVDPKSMLSFEDEKNRYLMHNNDATDPGYRSFVKPLVDLVLAQFNPKNSGLDYGSGTGSAISQMLTEKGYNIKQYDPFFINNIDLLSQKYDYIICCEVIEHFRKPHSEFRQLRSMLNIGGELLCMTYLYNESIDFVKWYYKDDATHIFFYHPKSLDYIKEQFNFSHYLVNERIIRFVV